MRTIVTACLMLSLGAAGADAADIQGKWGLGAGVAPFNFSVSLIRGKSERSAWLFDVTLSQLDRARDRQSFILSPPDVFTDQDNWTLVAGPGYRRFLRPEARVSPYWEVGVNGRYSRNHSSINQGTFAASNTTTRAGIGGQFAFGLEYFFRQHLSVAAHGNVASVAWLHNSRNSPTPTTVLSTTGHTMNASIGFSPIIFVRGYW